MKCKHCGRRVPKSHKDEFNLHKCLCRICYAIKTSKHVNPQRKGGGES